MTTLLNNHQKDSSSHHPSQASAELLDEPDLNSVASLFQRVVPAVQHNADLLLHHGRPVIYFAGRVYYLPLCFALR